MFNSMLDNDLYKFLMQSRIFELRKNNSKMSFQSKIRDFSGMPSHVTYSFFNRSNTPLCVDAEEFVERIRSLPKTFSENEISYLRTISLLDSEYVTSLTNKFFELDVFSARVPLRIHKDEAGRLSGFAYSGDWFDTILFEVPLMALVSEMHMEGLMKKSGNKVNIQQALDDKFKEDYNAFSRHRFVEFGTRRRFSSTFQKESLKRFGELKTCLGTSNVFLARELGMQPKGTLAHEWFLAAYAAVMKSPGSRPFDALGYANRYAFHHWIGYRGPEYKYGPLEREDLLNNTAFLTDTFGSELFFGCLHDIEDIQSFRHDSGDWKRFVEIVKSAHEKENLPFKNKTIMFSDSLNADKMLEIASYMNSTDFRYMFGVGTYLSNAVPGYKPLNIVVKPISFDGIPVVKTSDDPGKVTGSADSREIIAAAHELKKLVEQYSS